MHLNRDYFAMAAADAELQPLRAHVDELLGRLTDEADAALEVQCASFTALTDALAPAEAVVGAVPGATEATARVINVVEAARERGTFARLWRAHDIVKQVIGDVERTALTAIDAHIASVQRAIAAEDQAKAGQVRAITSAHETSIKAVQSRADTDVKRAGCVAQLAVFVVSFGAFAVGLSLLGFYGAAPVVSLGIAIVIALAFPSLWSAFTRNSAAAAEQKLTGERQREVATAEQRAGAARGTLESKLLDAQRLRTSFAKARRR